MTETVTVTYGGLTLPVPVHGIFERNFGLHFTTYYNRRPDSLLNGLCDKYGCDKGEVAPESHPYPWPSHSYADVIERLFGHCREHVRNVFECGLGTNDPEKPQSMGAAFTPGASLRVWRDYFPNAHIWGADIDTTILFQDERISTFGCDQTDPAQIAALWAQIPDVQFDLMIDDGLHNLQAGSTLLENSLHRLKPGGLYIIEDVSVTTLLGYMSWFQEHPYDAEFVNLYRKAVPLGDNSLVIVRK